MKKLTEEKITLAEAMRILKKDYMVGVIRALKWQEMHICIALMCMERHGAITEDQKEALTAKVFKKIEGHYTLYGYLNKKGMLSEEIKNARTISALRAPEYITLRDKFIDEVIEEIGPDRYV